MLPPCSDQWTRYRTGALHIWTQQRTRYIKPSEVSMFCEWKLDFKTNQTVSRYMCYNPSIIVIFRLNSILVWDLVCIPFCSFEWVYSIEPLSLLCNPLGGSRMSLVWISKPAASCIGERAMSLSVFYHCICGFLSLSQFQPIFVSFVAIYTVLWRCLSAMSLVGISPNRVSLAAYQHIKRPTI